MLEMNPEKHKRMYDHNFVVPDIRSDTPFNQHWTNGTSGAMSIGHLGPNNIAANADIEACNWRQSWLQNIRVYFQHCWCVSFSLAVAPVACKRLPVLCNSYGSMKHTEAHTDIHINIEKEGKYMRSVVQIHERWDRQLRFILAIITCQNKAESGLNVT